MNEVKVNLKNNSYSIVVGSRILPKLGVRLRFLPSLKGKTDAVVITNKNIARLHGKTVVAGLKRGGFSVKVFDVPDSEKSKSFKTTFELIKKIATHDVKRRIFIVALGGGVIGDLAGFIAAVYKRGVPYIQIPTTLLAQIDSAIGGKVAIDLPFGKNLVGAFYQPKLVWSDVSALFTLSQRQIRNGLAEAVKYGVIKDKKLFDYIEANYKGLLNQKADVFEKVIMRCSQIKADVVRVDEKETKGVRTILNFGHTVGHGIEAASSYRIQHGEAVALGMRVVARISKELGLAGARDCVSLERLLDKIGLPSRIKGVNLSSILKAMQYDKKIISQKNRFVLLKKIGQVKVVEGVPVNVIRKAIKAYR